VTEFVATDDQADPSPEAATVEQKLIDQLVGQARSKGLWQWTWSCQRSEFSPRSA
jgi:hypothetical protein